IRGVLSAWLAARYDLVAAGLNLAHHEGVWGSPLKISPPSATAASHHGGNPPPEVGRRCGGSHRSKTNLGRRATTGGKENHMNAYQQVDLILKAAALIVSIVSQIIPFVRKVK